MKFLKKGFEIRYKTGKQGWRPVESELRAS